MSQESIGNVAKKIFAVSHLIAGAAATVASAALDGPFDVSNVGEKALTIGAPTVVGAAIGALVDTEVMKYSKGGQASSTSGLLITGLVGGAATAAFLQFSGVAGDGSFVMLGLISGGAIILGDIVTSDL